MCDQIWMIAQHSLQFRQEGGIGGFTRTNTFFVQNRDDATMFSFYQLANFFIVKILDRLPLNFFTSILLLFRFQCQLDKKLLQLFVAVVDAKLFKTITAKYFKTINVKQPDHIFSIFVSMIAKRIVQLSNQPAKQSFVNRFGQCITSIDGLITRKRRTNLFTCKR